MTKTQTSVAPCSLSAWAPAIRVDARRGDVVAHDRDLAADAAGDLGDRDEIVARAGLVHDREVGVDHLGEPDGVLCAARIGCDRDDALAGQPEVAEMPGEERQARHVVDRDREEALDLAGVEIHRQDTVGAGQLQHVGDEPRGDRLARLRLAVLARVREPRDDRGDPLGRCELRRLDHQQQLHQVLVDRLAARLHDEQVGAADRLVVAAVGLAVPERVQLDLAELDAELLGDPLARAPGASGRRRPSAASAARARASGPAATGSQRLRLEAGKDELSRRAAGLHTPPCSPGVAERCRAHRRGRPW